MRVHTPLVDARRLRKAFAVGSATVTAVDGVDLEVDAGDFVAVVGPSGSGKSTLLHILGCLERPTTGTYCLDGRDVSRLDDRELSRVRGGNIGFIFQTFHLVEDLDVQANVELPFLYSELPRRVGRRRARHAIERVGLSARLRHRPTQLSGGEMQRVAIARALAIDPMLVLADEPTGNLDTHTGQEILDVLENLNAEGVTLIVVTHDERVARRAHRTLFMREGCVESLQGAAR